jgi:flagellar hook capping protein FlgD/fibronectin type III domain protein
MDDRLSRHRTPSRTRREIFPALLLLAMALASLATPPPARAQGAGADSVTLSWTAPGDDGNTGTAQSYDVRMSQATITETNWSSASSVSGAPVPLPAGTHQSMVVRGLTNGVTYYFAIKARDDAGNVAPISNVARWDWNLDTAPPQAPTGVSASVVNGGSSVQLRWNANVEPDLASYTVYRRTEAGGTFDPIATSLTSTSYADNALPAGVQSVWYQISATDNSGNESAHSATVAASLGSSSPATSWNLNPAYPNPGTLSSPVTIPIDVPPAGPGSAQLQITDGGGHVIRRLDLSGLLSGSQTITWDGKNSTGRQAAPGVYTAWLVGADTAKSLKIVRVP